MYRVLIVDDHSLIRSAMAMMLSGQSFKVVGEAKDGVEAVQMARDYAADLIILDISMPRLDGLEVISRIRASGVTSRILVLTSLPALFYSQRCMKAGADGFVTKSQDLNELLRAIKAIMSGYMFFPNLKVSSVRNSDATLSEAEMIQRLSDRELTILQQLARGLSNKQIAEDMMLSSKTISTYKARLIEKLSMKSVVYLADFAKRNQLI